MGKGLLEGQVGKRVVLGYWVGTMLLENEENFGQSVSKVPSLGKKTLVIMGEPLVLMKWVLGQY